MCTWIYRYVFLVTRQQHSVGLGRQNYHFFPSLALSLSLYPSLFRPLPRPSRSLPAIILWVVLPFPFICLQLAVCMQNCPAQSFLFHFPSTASYLFLSPLCSHSTFFYWVLVTISQCCTDKHVIPLMSIVNSLTVATMPHFICACPSLALKVASEYLLNCSVGPANTEP